jgi:hypothetical protein
MARTKQTARMCMASLPAQKKKKSISKGIGGRGRVGTSRITSAAGHPPMV